MRGQRDGFIERQLARLRVRDSAARDQHQHCRCNRPDRSRPGTTLVNQNVENGNYDKSEEHRTYQSKCNRAPQRRPHARAGKNHGRDADRRRHRRQEDGPQSAFAGFDGGLLDRDAFLHALASVVHQNDGIAHHDAAQADDAQKSGETEGIVGHQQADRRAQQTERDRGHDDERLDHRTELEHENEIDRDRADEQGVDHLRKCFLLIFVFAPVPHAIARRQGEFIRDRTNALQHLARQYASLRPGADGERADAVAADNASGIPDGRHRGDAVQRHSRAGYGRHHVSIGDIVEGLAPRGLQPQGDGHIALAFPIRCHRRAFEPACEHLSDGGVGESQTVGHFLAEIYLQAIRILAPVAMYVQSSRSAQQQLAHLIAPMPQHGLVIAGKANLERGLLDRTLLQFAEEHTCFRSRLREVWAQLFHQLRCDFRRLGRDQHLCVVLVRQLRIDIVVEPRKARPDERGEIDNFLLVTQHVLDALHRGLGRFHLPAFRKPDVDHELVALGEREETLRNDDGARMRPPPQRIRRMRPRQSSTAWRLQSRGCRSPA